MSITNTSEWVSVEDELPSRESYFLVTDGIKITICNFGYVNSRGGFYWNFEKYEHLIDWDASKVTHWMPLPAPPKIKPASTDTDTESLMKKVVKEVLDGLSAKEKKMLYKRFG